MAKERTHCEVCGRTLKACRARLSVIMKMGRL